MNKFKYKSKILPAIILCLVSINLYASPVEFNNLTILVSSCDKYASFWPPFFNSLYKNWPSLQTVNKQVPIFLVANKKSFFDPRITMINIYQERSWSDNMLHALAAVKTKYVLIALDDYWIDQPVNELRLLQLYNGMQAENAAMLQISNNDPRYQTGAAHPNLPHVMFTNKFALYKASLQLAIWDKEALISILKPGEDPWTFEISGSARSHGYPAHFLSLSGDEPIKYINAAHQGHINPTAIAYAKQNNLHFVNETFPILGKFNYKLIYNLWKKRSQRVIAFIRHPGFMYQFD